MSLAQCFVPWIIPLSPPFEGGNSRCFSVNRGMSYRCIGNFQKFSSIQITLHPSVESNIDFYMRNNF